MSQNLVGKLVSKLNVYPDEKYRNSKYPDKTWRSQIHPKKILTPITLNAPILDDKVGLYLLFFKSL
jgi:hypothetical protein